MDTPRRKLHVVLRKEDLDPARLTDKAVLVIDTLFATTSIVTALAHGARQVLPALDHDEARQIAASREDADRLVLAGELDGEVLPGFAHPTPQALAASGLQGRIVVLSTTNGTIALRRAQGAHAVYAVCLRNARASMRDALLRYPGRTVILLCAGSAGAFNIEDFFTAGLLVRHFLELTPSAHLTDSAQAALVCSSAAALPTLMNSRVGRRFSEHWRDEIEYAARIDSEQTVARLVGRSVVLG